MIYYMNEVSPACLDVITQGTTMGISQEGEGMETVFIDALPILVERGIVCLYHEGPVVYMLRRKTAWVGFVDIFIGNNGTIKDAIKAGRNAIAWAAENTEYHKLESRSPSPTMPILARRLGFRVEGYREQSFKGPDGEMLDEVEVGLILRSTSCHKLH